MRNGTAKRSQQTEDRFGTGRSREGDEIARALNDSSGAAAPDASAPSAAEIAERAYEIYLGRGGEGGSAEQDWYAAEQELRSRRRRGD